MRWSYRISFIKYIQRVNDMNWKVLVLIASLTLSAGLNSCSSPASSNNQVNPNSNPAASDAMSKDKSGDAMSQPGDAMSKDKSGDAMKKESTTKP